MSLHSGTTTGTSGAAVVSTGPVGGGGTTGAFTGCDIGAPWDMHDGNGGHVPRHVFTCGAQQSAPGKHVSILSIAKQVESWHVETSLLQHIVAPPMQIEITVLATHA